MVVKENLQAAQIFVRIHNSYQFVGYPVLCNALKGISI